MERFFFDLFVCRFWQHIFIPLLVGCLIAYPIIEYAKQPKIIEVTE